MGVGEGVSFRATNFMGGGNSSRSFTERLDRKERMKRLDEQNAAREAENLRRYEIAQNRLKTQDDIAATERGRQHTREDVVDTRNTTIFKNQQTDRKTKLARDVVTNSQNDALFDVNMFQKGNEIEDKNKARERIKVTQGYEDTNQANSEEEYAANKKKADAAALIQAAKDEQFNKNMAGVKAIPEILMNTNTEMADALNMKYKFLNDAPENTPEEVSKNKLALEELDRTTIKLYDDGKLDLNRVTNPKQYGARLTKDLYERGVDPIQTKAIVDSYTENALDESKTADATTAQMLADEKERYKIAVAANDKKEQQGNLADAPSIVKATKDELDNTVQDAYGGLEVNKKTGKVQIKGKNNDDDNYRVGNQEIEGFVTDLLLADFTVAEKKLNGGKTATKQKRRPTKSEVISAIKKASYTNNLVRADHIDGEETLQYLEAIMKKNGMNPTGMKKSDRVLADINQKRKNKIVKDNKNPTGEQRLDEMFKIERALAEERLRSKRP